MKMLTRSLATYMNAWTLPDCTLYPFSSQNRSDFCNLARVYWDACFNPLLRLADFRQEGWRLEREGSLKIKGVVFNEMKGVFSSKAALFQHALTSSLLKGTSFEFESGGLPSEIPSLSHQNLIDFHGKHYTVGNCRIFTYGSFLLEQNVDLLEELLSETAITPAAANLDVAREGAFRDRIWTSNQEVSVSCPMIEDAKSQNSQSIVATAWTGCRTEQLQETFDLSVAMQLLIDGPSSPMYKRLIATGLGNEFSPASGIDTSATLSVLSIGLQAVQPNLAVPIREAIDDCLRSVVKEGFSPSRIGAIIHQLSVAKKYRSKSFGIDAVSSIMPGWLRSSGAGSPIEPLQISQRIHSFQERYRTDPNYLQRLIEQFLIFNNQRLFITMHPDPSYTKKVANEEDRLIQTLPETPFASEPASEADSSVLPTLAISDIEVLQPFPEWREVKGESRHASLMIRDDALSNGLSFSRCYVQIRPSTKERFMHLPIAHTLLSSIGVSGWPLDQWTEHLRSNVGSASFSLEAVQPFASERVVYYTKISGHSLDSKLEELFRSLDRMRTESNFSDLQRFSTLFNAEYLHADESISTRGNEFAVSYAAASACSRAYQRDLLFGLRHVHWMRNVLRDVSEKRRNLEEEIGIVKEIVKDDLFAGPRVTQFFISSQENGNEKQFYCEEAYNRLVQKCSSASHQSLLRLRRPQGSSLIFMPFGTNFVGAAAACALLPSHQDSATLKILCILLRSKHLLREIRELGGAYGASISFSLLNGLITASSYRDPNPLRSIETFQSLHHWLKTKASWTDQDLLEAKLAAFQDLDAPVDFHKRDIQRAVVGMPKEEMEKHRSNILAVSLPMLQDCADRYFGNLNFSYSVIGPNESASDFEKLTTSRWKLVR